MSGFVSQALLGPHGICVKSHPSGLYINVDSIWIAIWHAPSSSIHSGIMSGTSSIDANNGFLYKACIVRAADILKQQKKVSHRLWRVQLSAMDVLAGRAELAHMNPHEPTALGGSVGVSGKEKPQRTQTFYLAALESCTFAYESRLNRDKIKVNFTAEHAGLTPIEPEARVE